MSTEVIQYRHKQTKIIVAKVCQLEKVFFTPISPVANCVTPQEIPGWVVENSQDWQRLGNPLFVTKDNVDVYDRDKVYYVDSVFDIRELIIRYTTKYIDIIAFHSELAAKEYVEQHKPTYSLFEIGMALTRYNLADHFIQGILNNIKTKNNG